MKKQVIVIAVLLSFVSLVIPSIPAYELNLNKTWYVDDDATYPFFGTKENPFRYIQNGIDNGITFDGDTVYVFNGTYNETVVVYKSINLIGEDKNTTFIIGDEINSSVSIIINHVIISGFTIKNDNDVGIDLSSSSIRISDSIITTNRVGIRGLEESFDNTIYHNIFINNIKHVYDKGTNNWDNGYHSGGNYWDNYTGSDNYHGPKQDIPGSDGKGDTPYSISGISKQDNYPFINPDGWRNKPPTANFVYRHHSPTDLNIIYFTDTSIDTDGYIDSWYWDFGDGITSTLQNPTHHYPVENCTYLVNLTVIDDDGSSNIILKDVIIGNYPPVADTNGPYAADIDEVIVFDGSGSYDPDGTINSWMWDFGDGNIGSGEKANHNYSSSGVYNVSLKVMDNKGSVGTDYTFCNICSDIVYVDDDYTSSTPGWGYDHFDNIQRAVDTVEEGGTVYVYSGLYNDYFPENYSCVKIEKKIHLVGENKFNTIINGSGRYDVVKAFADGVSISGFTIQNGGESQYIPGTSCYGRGIYVWKKNVSIYDNIIFDNYVGIDLSSDEGTVFDNTIMVNRMGMDIHRAAIFNEIYNNTISHNEIGIEKYGDSCTFEKNNISNNEVGILLIAGKSNFISNNVLRDNEIGLKTEEYGASTIRQNNFINNDDHAIVSRWSTVLQTPLRIPFRNNWIKNYWDNWNRNIPRLISGRWTIELRLFPSPMTIPIARFPYFEMDRLPAKEPYVS